MKTITIVMSGDKSQFDFDGFVGQGCQQAEEKIRLLQTMLGLRSEEDERIPLAGTESEAVPTNLRQKT